MRTFKHSGATGDMIYSLAVVRDLGGGDFHITMADKQRSESVQKLIEVQPYINSCHIGEPASFTNNLDDFRAAFNGAHDSIIEAHYRSQGIGPNPNYKEGWLSLPTDYNPLPGKRYAVINRTERYNDPNCNWTAELEYLRSFNEEIYFIGYYGEWDTFRRTYGECNFIEVDFLEGAYLLKNASIFTGGYSAWAVVAQGLGIPYRLEQAPGHTCSSFFIERETIINL